MLIPSEQNYIQKVLNDTENAITTFASQIKISPKEGIINRSSLAVQGLIALHKRGLIDAHPNSKELKEIIATPLVVACENMFMNRTEDPADIRNRLSALANTAWLFNQIGYHEGEAAHKAIEQMAACERYREAFQSIELGELLDFLVYRFGRQDRLPDDAKNDFERALQMRIGRLLNNALSLEDKKKTICEIGTAFMSLCKLEYTRPALKPLMQCFRTYFNEGTIAALGPFIEKLSLKDLAIFRYALRSQSFDPALLHYFSPIFHQYRASLSDSEVPERTKMAQIREVVLIFIDYIERVRDHRDNYQNLFFNYLTTSEVLERLPTIFEKLSPFDLAEIMRMVSKPNQPLLMLPVIHQINNMVGTLEAAEASELLAVIEPLNDPMYEETLNGLLHRLGSLPHSEISTDIFTTHFKMLDPEKYSHPRYENFQIKLARRACEQIPDLIQTVEIGQYDFWTFQRLIRWVILTLHKHKIGDEVPLDHFLDATMRKDLRLVPHEAAMNLLWSLEHKQQARKNLINRMATYSIFPARYKDKVLQVISDYFNGTSQLNLRQIQYLTKDILNTEGRVRLSGFSLAAAIHVISNFPKTIVSVKETMKKLVEKMISNDSPDQELVPIIKSIRHFFSKRDPDATSYVIALVSALSKRENFRLDELSKVLIKAVKFCDQANPEARPFFAKMLTELSTREYDRDDETLAAIVSRAEESLTAGINGRCPPSPQQVEDLGQEFLGLMAQISPTSLATAMHVMGNIPKSFMPGHTTTMIKAIMQGAMELIITKASQMDFTALSSAIEGIGRTGERGAQAQSAMIALTTRLPDFDHVPAQKLRNLLKIVVEFCTHESVSVDCLEGILSCVSMVQCDDEDLDAKAIIDKAQKELQALINGSTSASSGISAASSSSSSSAKRMRTGITASSDVSENRGGKRGRKG